MVIGVRLMYALRCMLLVLMVGSLSGAEYTPRGCDCNTPTIETLEIEEDYLYIQYLIYYPEENNTTIIYKI